MYKVFLDGILRTTANYKNGKLHGSNKIYYLKSNSFRILNFKNGEYKGLAERESGQNFFF